MFSIYEKTVNHKTSRKVSFGSYIGPLQIPIDIGPNVVNPSCRKQTICVLESKRPVTRMAITRTVVEINFPLFFLSRVTSIDTFIPIYGQNSE